MVPNQRERVDDALIIALGSDGIHFYVVAIYKYVRNKRNNEAVDRDARFSPGSAPASNEPSFVRTRLGISGIHANTYAECHRVGPECAALVNRRNSRFSLSLAASWSEKGMIPLLPIGSFRNATSAQIRCSLATNNEYSEPRSTQNQTTFSGISLSRFWLPGGIFFIIICALLNVCIFRIVPSKHIYIEYDILGRVGGKVATLVPRHREGDSHEQASSRAKLMEGVPYGTKEAM